MNIITKANHSKYTIIILLILSFIVMFGLNSLTPYILDDFGYMFNFSTGEMMKSIKEVVPSMIAHSKTMNGRVLSHGLEQIFLLMPKFVFNFFNSAVYCCVVFLIYKYCCKEKDNALIYISIFMSIWVFTPEFGQDYLWQVGAVNYLWGIVFCLVFFKSFVDAFLYDEIDKPIISKVLYIVISLLAGSYIEGAATIAVFGGIVFAIILSIKYHHVTWHCFQVLASIIGFAFLLSQPAELSKKIGDSAFHFASMLRNIDDLTGISRDFFLVLITIWLVLIVISIFSDLNRDRSILSILFFFFAFVSVYEMSIASEISLRCFGLTTIFLILSICLLLAELKYKAMVACLVVSLLPIFFVRFTMGSIDIYNYFLNFKYRESIIYTCSANGETDINIPYLYTKTTYCPTHSTMEISLNPNSWPNCHMAEYYGVSSLTGY